MNIGDTNTLNGAKAYSDSRNAITLSDANNYTDAAILELDTFVTGLENFVTVIPAGDNGPLLPRIVFHGVNLQLVDGSGQTYGYPPYNGLGNFIIGYDEANTSPPSVKNVSHNLVIGGRHTYSSQGGFVAGFKNEISGVGATVCVGTQNTASGIYSSVSGGTTNLASGENSSVSGGVYKTATYANDFPPYP